MDRLISEQAVIESIEFFQMNPQHFDFVNLIDDIKDIPSAEPRWIPCKVRLPEENGVYIVSYEDSIRLLEWFNGKWFFYPSNPAREETGTIIAWQPLPRHYNTESVNQ